MQALALLPNDLKLPLVVVGKGGRYEKQVRQYLADKAMEQWVHFIRPDFEHLPAIYQGASVFLYPSVCEGFGIPVIEALCSGVPVITSNRSSLPEAAGAHSWLVDPTSAEEIAEGIRVFLTDASRREKAIHEGLIHVEKFRDAVVTQQMLALYRNMLKD